MTKQLPLQRPNKDIKWNGQAVNALRSAVINCNINIIPEVVRTVLVEESWRSFVDNRQKYENESFLEFIEGRPLKGCGWKEENVAALIKQSGDAEVLQMWRVATTAPRGTNQHSSPGTTLKPQRGNTRAYLLDRLKREEPKLFADVANGKLKAKQAAREAGWKGYELRQRCPKCGHEW